MGNYLVSDDEIARLRIHCSKQVANILNPHAEEHDCVLRLIQEVKELRKEVEITECETEYRPEDLTAGSYKRYFKCGKCGERIPTHQKYCGCCGAKHNWEGILQ